jgi:rhamnogalacturonyl hydrolase YesR
MMASLLQYQADNGMWRQIIDDSASWPETSSTGMFTFAMITGVKMGGSIKKHTDLPHAKPGSHSYLISMKMPTSAKCARAQTKRTIASITSIANV